MADSGYELTQMLDNVPEETETEQNAYDTVPNVAASVLKAQPGCLCNWCKGARERKLVRNPSAYTGKSSGVQLEVLHPDTIRTQKAVGLGALFRAQPAIRTEVLPAALIQTAKLVQRAFEYAKHFPNPGDPLWCRPCPTRPRHGFIDSREVSSVDDIKALWKEARKADPKAELLLQRKQNAVASAIVTPNTLTVGASNDGATAGRGAWSLTLADGAWSGLLKENPEQLLLAHGLPLDLLEDSRIAWDEVPYAEVVFTSGMYGEVAVHAKLVQLRGGPPLPGAVKDWIPDDITVQHVLHVQSTDDLLEWEKAVAKAAPGTVVYHAQGSLASHYGIHCWNNGVPYITTEEPHVGDKLAQTVIADTPNVEAFRAGLLVGANGEAQSEFANMQHLSFFTSASIFSLHNFSADHTELGSYIAGVGLGTLWRLLACACLGELRHRSRFLKDAQSVTVAKGEEWEIGKWRADRRSGVPYRERREKVFSRAFTLPNEKLHHYLRIAAWSNLAEPWPNTHGGLYWGRSAVAGLELYDCMYAVSQSPTVETVRRCVEQFNIVVNMIHNGGWLFNKFASAATMDGAARMLRTFILNEAVPGLLTWQQLSWDVARPLPSPKKDWREYIGKTLVDYSANPRSCKRGDDPSGSLDVLEAKVAEKEGIQAAEWINITFKWLGECINNTKAEAAHWIALAVSGNPVYVQTGAIRSFKELQFRPVVIDGEKAFQFEAIVAYEKPSFPGFIKWTVPKERITYLNKVFPPAMNLLMNLLEETLKHPAFPLCHSFDAGDDDHFLRVRNKGDWLSYSGKNTEFYLAIPFSNGYALHFHLRDMIIEKVGKEPYHE